MNFKNLSKIIITVFAIYSSFSMAKNEEEPFHYEFICDDLHQGKMIVDSVIGAYPEYEMDDGYSGRVKLNITEKQVFIYRDGDLVVHENISSDAVEMDDSLFLKVTISEYNYFSFSLGLEDLALTQHVFSEGELVDDAFLECENKPGVEKSELLKQYIFQIKNSHQS